MADDMGTVKRILESDPALAKLPTAFVAMKFGGDPWKDKRYQIIREVAEEAGYNVVRGDEISSSGPVVDEVCKLLRDAELVIIATTGDSHSVSYEVGYCHGVGRTAKNVVLLRQGSGTDLPFNYRHYRNNCYKDLRHLRRVLREWLDLSIPLPDSKIGYCFRFEVHDDIACYGADVAEALLAALRQTCFSGRCEFYAGDMFGMERPTYLVGIGLKPSVWAGKRTEASELIDEIIRALPSALQGITLEANGSEFTTLHAIKRSLIPAGVVEYKKGMLVRIISPAAFGSDSWFVGAINTGSDSVDGI
jgi:hypothetical protein